MAFEGIHRYFERFSKLKPPERFVRERVIEDVYAVCGITLRPFEVSVQGSVVYITTNPVVKSEIMLKKQVILKRIRDHLEGLSITEIR